MKRDTNKNQITATRVHSWWNFFLVSLVNHLLSSWAIDIESNETCRSRVHLESAAERRRSVHFFQINLPATFSMSTENHSNSSVEDEKDDSGIEQDQSWIYIRIAVEDLHLQKVLKFNLDQTVWNAKQKVLQVLVRVKFTEQRRFVFSPDWTNFRALGAWRWNQLRSLFAALQRSSGKVSRRVSLSERISAERTCRLSRGLFIDRSATIKMISIVFQFKYKRRVYKSLTVIHKTLHSKVSSFSE